MIEKQAIASGSDRARYDDRIVYLPRVDLLRPGDILLTRNAEAERRRDMKQSDIIQRMTGGRFSHALICSSPPAFIEAVGSGVSILSMARSFTHDVENVRLLRLPDADIAARAAQLAQDEVGRDYSVARAVGSILPVELVERMVRDHGTFCSALVGQAFARAGAAQFAATPADRITPATIEKLKGLEDLTETVFRPKLAPNNLEEMSALDGDRAPTLSSEQTRISADCARKLWPRATAITEEYSELDLEVVPTLYGILRFVTKAVENRDDIGGNRHTGFDQALAELDCELAAFIRASRLSALFRDISAHDDAILQRNLRESFQVRPDIDVEAMRAFLVAGRAMYEARSQSVQNWQDWGLERSAAMAAWAEIDQVAANATRLRNLVVEEVLVRLGIPLP